MSAATTETDDDDTLLQEGLLADEEAGTPYRGKVFDDLPITFADISRAEVAIRGGVKRTYCEHSPFISELVGANVYFKGEYKQFTGSFKERGARNAILTLMRQKKNDLRGVIAASAGNHAQALAYHGMLLGVPATVVMPVVAPLAKVDKCRVRFFSLSEMLFFHGDLRKSFSESRYFSLNYLFLYFAFSPRDNNHNRNLELASLLKESILVRQRSMPKHSWPVKV
jgi:Pyridoxal-phosphate dependent enzyme